MPSGIVRSSEEETDWNRAKDIVREQYPGKEDEDKDGFYALVTTVFKSIRKGHGDERYQESRDLVSAWAALLEESKRVTYPRELLTGPRNLRHGDYIRVTTLSGRRLSEGEVRSITPHSVTVKVQRGIVQTDTVYENMLSRYVLVARDDDERKKQNLREWFDGDVDLEDVPDQDLAPEIKIIMQALSWIESQQEASVLWHDITSRGFEQAMKMHGVGADSAGMLWTKLYKGAKNPFRK